MVQILPIKELKNTARISEMVHSSSEPVYITKNGYGDMVLMSMEAYEKLMGRISEVPERKEESREYDAKEALRSTYGL